MDSRPSREALSAHALGMRDYERDQAANPEPLTAEEEAKFRESVRRLGRANDWSLQWSNTAVAHLFATLDAARSQRDTEPLREAARTLVDWYDGPPYIYVDEEMVPYIAALRAALGEEPHGQ